MPLRCSISTSSASAEIDHRAGPHHGRLGRHLGTGVVVAEVQRQLILVGGQHGDALDLEFTLEITDGQVGQIEGALVRPGEVGGQLGVGRQPVQVQTRAQIASSGPFASCIAFRVWRRPATWPTLGPSSGSCDLTST